MSIEFENEQTSNPTNSSAFTPQNQPIKSKLIDWIIQKSIVKNEKQAIYFLIGTCLLFLLVMTYVFNTFVFGFKLPVSEQERTISNQRILKERAERMQREPNSF